MMIPGPVEISPAVRRAFAAAPPSHRGPELIESFGRALERMLAVWQAADDSRPFAFSGSGTVAMEMAVANLAEPGDRMVVVDTGFFSRRMAEILRRAGAEVEVVGRSPGDVPAIDEVAETVAAGASPKALWLTHVDTSTGVRLDPAPFARLAREHGVLSVFDGVCSAGGEQLDMAGWDADVYLTGSQKALGLPPGLGLMVVGPRAWAAREARRAAPPPLYLDWHSWQPVMEAYRAGRPSYFATPATNLVLALEVGLGEILDQGLAERPRRHVETARALRAAWAALGLSTIPLRDEVTAHVLSALHLPDGVELRELLSAVRAHGVTVASGLHPDIPRPYFRIGHMGWVTGQPELLLRTVEAVARGLADVGQPVSAERAASAFEERLASSAAR